MRNIPLSLAFSLGLAATQPAWAAEPLFERELLATGSVTWEDPLRIPPTNDAPLWIEVALFRDPLEAWCIGPCVPTQVGEHVWSGPAEVGDNGAWTARLTRGTRALPVLEPVPAIDLRHDYAIRVSAWLGTTPERCFAWCAARARVAAEEHCAEATDPMSCRAGVQVRSRDDCELDCAGPTAWAIAGTTWITSGEAHASMHGPTATLVAPRIELERLVTADGKPLD